MAGKVFVSVSMSLDGFIAPGSLEGFVATEERRDDPEVQRWMAQWMELQQWIFPLRFFRENLKLGEGGENAPPRQRASRCQRRPAAASLDLVFSPSSKRAVTNVRMPHECPGVPARSW